MNWRFKNLKENLDPRGGSAPDLGITYMYITIIFKDLLL